jgi:hypothetical protein
MRHTLLSLSLAATTAFVATTAITPSAQACGGCFAPPGAIQSVTDHRMVLAVSATQTTLWDQFSYSGRPENFSWILPVRNGPNVEINLADDRFMTVLDNLSVPTLYAPQRPTQYCGGGWAEDFNAGPRGFADAASAPQDAGVTVFREDTVGPYAIAVIGGNDAMAVRVWLRDNGFSVPAAIEPVIDYYVGIRSDFLALKLRAGASVNRMNPVRVTVPGYAPTLPLRMVSAGISDKVGLNLVVIAGSRFEAANFPNGELTNNDLTWDWNANPAHVPADDFRAAQRALNQRLGGRAWLTESASQQDARFLSNIAQNARFALQRPPGSPPICPADAMMGGTPCIEPSPELDMAVALRGLGTNVTVTRLKAELSGTALDRDLQLQPAANAGDRPREYSYGVILNPPPPPPPCANPGPARVSTQQAIRCSTTPAMPTQFGVVGLAFAAALGATLSRKARKNRSS